MRRLTLGLCAVVLTELILAVPAAESRDRGRRARGPIEAIQPLESDSGLVLLSRAGWARIEDEHGRHRVRVGRTETLSTVAQTRSGWIAAGVRSEVEGSQVFVISESGSSAERLPPLPRSEAVQLRPVLLIANGSLLGAAWLEGESFRSLGVRFAEWQGIAWSKATTISRPGAGSQTGLSGVALERGGALLVWSRFERGDDEIYWSRLDGAAWSRPERLGQNNSTPDVTPVVAATSDGATLVWGRLEQGDYRLFSRRFTGDSWVEQERSIGPRGSVFPTLTSQGDRLYVLFQSVTPSGWSVGELDGDGALAKRALVTTGGTSRPVVKKTSSHGPVLRWIGPHKRARANWSVP